MDESYVKSVLYALPPELIYLQGAGYFDEFNERAGYHLKREDLPDEVKDRIILEMHNNEIMRSTYTMTEQTLIKGIMSYCPGFTAQDFKKLAGDTDYIFVNGRKRYAGFSVSSLFITSRMLREWPGSTYPEDKDQSVRDSRKLMKKNGSATVDIDIEFICDVSSRAARGNRLTVHLPYPTTHSSGVKKVEFLSASQETRRLAPDDAPQRTICFRADGDRVRHFSARCRAEVTETYMAYSDIVKAGRETGDAEEKKLRRRFVRRSDLAEKEPCWMFTPFIRALSAKIIGNESDQTRMAKKIYDYLIHNYAYAYVRDYAAIENIGEYFGIRGRGDCGLQASLFITLCRYNGIPARWESGICTDGKSGGPHDWALCWFRGVGFRPVDVSFGGGQIRRGDEKEAGFYFGNIDPYRLMFNSDIREPFDPAKKFYRYDPYDNQVGEAESREGMLPRKEVSFSRIIHSRTIR